MHLLLIAVLIVFGSVGVAPQGAPASVPKPVVTPVDSDDLMRILSDLKGRVVVLNFWATWCVPCIEEFPELVRLREKHADEGLEVVFVSIDDQTRTRREVEAALKRMQVTFETFIKQTRDDEAFINAVDPKWRGAIPATFVYDRRGRLVHSRIDQQTFQQLESLVTPLLGRQ